MFRSSSLASTDTSSQVGSANEQSPDDLLGQLSPPSPASCSSCSTADEGGEPHNRTKRITPSDQMSAGNPYGFSPITSGAM